ncbi:hypothetical protein [Neisseria sp. Ec49-e6-T10]|uniref:hypothetical protein n=1 Tax=Neisseria sp. Ec49-e6-T10 TaxID=3140744 RepID=UPI003EB7043D
MNHFSQYIIDPRQYPDTAPTNMLLHQAEQIIRSDSKTKAHLISLLTQNLHNYLQEHNTLPISVALAMVSNRTQYQTIWQALDMVLWQQPFAFVVLPVVMVIGSEQQTIIQNNIPEEKLTECLLKQGLIKNTQDIVWAKNWLDDQQFSGIKIDEWFLASQSQEAATEFLNQFSDEQKEITLGQQVLVQYAVGLVHCKDEIKLNAPISQFAMPLMNVFNAHFTQQQGLTIFTNPLAVQQPLAAMAKGSNMRLTMALDVFCANAIRAIRLQGLRVGAVVVAQQTNLLIFSFSPTDDSHHFETQGFVWPLSSMDDIDLILNNFLNLLSDCQVENIRFCQHIQAEDQPFLSYLAALKEDGIHPFFSKNMEKTH